MKKTLVAVAILIVVSHYSFAAVLEWNSLILAGANAPGSLTGSEDTGDGSGWWVEVWNYTTGDAVYHSEVPTALGWRDMGGEAYVIKQFSFDASRLDEVALRLYASTDENPSTPYDMIESQLYELPNVGDPPAAGSTDITFDFSGQEWQVVPEPGTMALFGLGLMTLAAKRMRKRRTA